MGSGWFDIETPPSRLQQRQAPNPTRVRQHSGEQAPTSVTSLQPARPSRGHHQRQPPVRQHTTDDREGVRHGATHSFGFQCLCDDSPSPGARLRPSPRSPAAASRLPPLPLTTPHLRCEAERIGLPGRYHRSARGSTNARRRLCPGHCPPPLKRRPSFIPRRGRQKRPLSLHAAIVPRFTAARPLRNAVLRASQPLHLHALNTSPPRSLPTAVSFSHSAIPPRLRIETFSDRKRLQDRHTIIHHPIDSLPHATLLHEPLRLPYISD